MLSQEVCTWIAIRDPVQPPTILEIIMTKYDKENSGPEKLQPMQPLAEELERAIMARLQGEEVPTSISIDQAINQAFADVAPPLITSRLHELSAAEFAEVYVRILGSEALKLQLEELADIKSAELERQVRMEQIRHEAETLGLLRMERLLPDEVIRIGLFNPQLSAEYACKSYAKNKEYGQIKPLQRIVAARIIDPQQSQVEIIYDNWVGAVWDQTMKKPGIRPLSHGTLDDRLQIHTPLKFKSETKDFQHEQIIGYVETNDGELLLDGNN